MHELFRGQRSRLAHQGSREDNLYQSPQFNPWIETAEIQPFNDLDQTGPDWSGQSSVNKVLMETTAQNFPSIVVAKWIFQAFSNLYELV